MSGSFEFVQRNACVHRLDTHPEEVLGNTVRAHVNSKVKLPSTTGSEEGRTSDTASPRIASPTHY